MNTLAYHRKFYFYSIFVQNIKLFVKHLQTYVSFPCAYIFIYRNNTMVNLLDGDKYSSLSHKMLCFVW